MRRLLDVEMELEVKQAFFEEASDDLERERGAWDKRMASAVVAATGSSQEKREAEALIAILATEDGSALYERLVDAKARYGAVKAAINSRTSRATILQSVLKGLTQEHYKSNLEPSWSQAA